MDSKTCKRCGKTKPRSEWYRHPYNPKWFSSYCKPCQNGYHKDWISKNREKDNRQAKASMNCNWGKYSHGICPHQVKNVALI